VTEVVKQIARLWQALPKDDKQRYKELAKLGKASFKNLTKNFSNFTETSYFDV